MVAMLAVAVFDETGETTDCAGGCGESVKTEDFNYFSEDSDGCVAGHFTGESGFYCDDCYPRCYCAGNGGE